MLAKGSGWRDKVTRVHPRAQEFEAEAGREPSSARPVLASSICFLREEHEDYGWWRLPLARREENR